VYPLIPHESLAVMLELIGCFFTLVTAAASYLVMMR